MLNVIDDRDPIRRTIVTLLDNGMDPAAILGVLSGQVIESLNLAPLIGNEANLWMTRTESKMQALAQDESWTRLGQLLATYQRVSKAQVH